MTITAKYPGVCRVCGSKIRVGQEIEWERGGRPAHAKCVTKSVSSSRAAEPKAPAAPAITVEVIGDYKLDEYDNLGFGYRLPDGEEQRGRDVTPNGFVFWVGSYSVADRDAKLAEALEAKARLISERQQLVESFRQRLLAGEKLLMVNTRGYDGMEYPVLGVASEVSAMDFRHYYKLVAELFPWLGRMGNAYGSYLRTDLPAGTLLSIEDVQSIEADAYNAWRQEREEHERHLAEIRNIRAAGGHMVVLQQCEECGRTRIVGEFTDDGHVVRMPEDVYCQAVAAQTAAHRRSAESAGDQILSSIGFDPEPGTGFEFRVVETYYCGC